MALTVNTNMSALNAQRNVNKTQGALQKSLARLSSGLRINSAKDDAAGLAISNRMGAQIRGLDQAVRNANDGISLAQTAEGAMGEVTTNLQRLRELAVQSANASNSVDDRAALQDEAKQLLDEIERIATQTEFNGTKLLDGSFKDQNFQIGANAGQTLRVTVDSTRTDKLGVSDTAALTAKGTGDAIGAGDLIINGVTIRSSSASDDTASYPSSTKAASAIAKAAAINASSSQTGVTATADENVLEGASMIGAAGSGILKLNGVDIEISTTKDTTTSRAAAVKAINAVSGQTGVVATDTGKDETGVTLAAADGRNITVQFGSPGSGTFDSSSTGIRGLSDNTLNGTSMTAAAGTGIISINGQDTDIITTSTDAAASRAAVVSAINAISDKTGVVAADGGSDSGGVTLTAADGRHITVAFSGISGAFGTESTGVGQVATTATGTQTGAAVGTDTLTINGTTVDPAGALDIGTTTDAYQTNARSIVKAINEDTTLSAQGIRISASQFFAAGNTLGIDSAGASGGTASSGTITVNYNGQSITTAAISLADTNDATANATAVRQALNLALTDAGITDFTFTNNAGNYGISVATGKTVSDLSIQSNVTTGSFDGASGFDDASASVYGNSVQVTSSEGDALTFGGPLKTVLGLTDVAASQGQAASTAAETDYGTYTLTSDKAINITAGAGANSSVANAGLSAGTYNAQTAYTSTTSNNGLAMGTGEVLINDVLVGASDASSDSYSRYGSTVSASDASKLTAASAIAKVAAINEISSKTGVTATANATVASGSNMTNATAGTGTITINGVTTSSIGVAAVGTDANVAASNRSAVIAAINAISEQTGVAAEDTNDMTTGIKLVAADGRNINIQYSGGLNGGNTGVGDVTDTTYTATAAGSFGTAGDIGTVKINGFETGAIKLAGTDADGLDTDGAAMAAKINEITDKTGVTATYDVDTDKMTLTAAGGQAITVEATATGDGIDLSDVGLGSDNIKKTVSGRSSTSFGTFTLSSASEFKIDKGNTANMDNTGLAVGTYGSGKTGMALSDVDISTVEGANEAITSIDNALKQIDSNRGKLGAVQNRFDATISNLSNVSENLSAARGRIVDADFAQETAALSKNQILQQAGVAMLAQANQLPQQILSLLQG